MRYKYLGIADRHKNKVYIDRITKKIFYKHPNGTADMVDIDDIYYLGRPKEDLKSIDKEKYKYCNNKVLNKLLKFYKPSNTQILGTLMNNPSKIEIAIRFKYIGKTKNNDTIYFDRKRNAIISISRFGILEEIKIDNKRLDKKLIKKIQETKELVSTNDIKIALLVIFLEIIILLKPSLEELVSDYKYEKYLKNKENHVAECEYTADKVIEEVISTINDNANLTAQEREYLTSYFIEYLKDYSYLLDDITIEEMFKQFYQLDIEYKPYDGGSTLGTYCNDEIIIYGEETPSDIYPENKYPSTFFHEEIHSAFNHTSIPLGKGVSLLEAYCGAVQLKYTDTTSYAQEQEYLLILSKILSVDEVNHFLANVDIEGLKEAIAKKCNVEIKEVESVIEKMDNAYEMYISEKYKVLTKRYEKLRYDISIELATLYSKSKGEITTYDIYLDNLLSKDIPETSFLDTKNEVVYAYKSNSWYESYIEYTVTEDNQFKSKDMIIAANAKEFIDYIYDNLQNVEISNTLELFMMLCDEEDLAIANKDNFYYILTNTLKKYDLTESTDEFILKYKCVLDDNYKIEEYYINEIFDLLLRKYYAKEQLSVNDHADINRLNEIIPYNTKSYYSSFINTLRINLNEEDEYINKYASIKWSEKKLEDPLTWKMQDNINLSLILDKRIIDGVGYFILPKFLTKYESTIRLSENYSITKLGENLVIDAKQNKIDGGILEIIISYQQIPVIEEQKVLSINSNNY